MFLHCQSNKSEHGDVVVLAEIDRSLSDGFRAGVADLEHTIESKRLAGSILGLDDSIGNKWEPPCLVQGEMALLIRGVRIKAQEQTR